MNIIMGTFVYYNNAYYYPINIKIKGILI